MKYRFLQFGVFEATPRRVARMLPPRHTPVARRRRRHVAGLAVMAVLTAWAAPRSAAAQTPGDRPPAEAARKVDAADALQLHALVRRWLDEGGVPPQRPEPLVVRDAVGVGITLRVDGVTLGFGQAMVPDAITARGLPSEAVDLIALTREAAGLAFEQTLDRLRRASVRARVEGFTTDPNEPARLAEVASRLLVDIQIARGLEPIDLPANARLIDLLRSFASGYHGVVLLDDTDRFAVTWPARALALNLAPDRQLHRLLSDLDLPLENLEAVGKPDGPRLARFAVIHVVRPTADVRPTQLVRGNPPTETFGAVTTTVETLTEALTRHLASRFTADGFRGTYEPTPSRYEPPLAPVPDQMLATYALLRRYALDASRRGLDADTRFQIRRLMDHAEQLGERVLERGPMSHQALALLCLDADPLSQHDVDLAQALTTRLLASVDRGDEVGRSEADRAVIAAALARRYDRRRQTEAAEAVLSLVEPMWGHEDPAGRGQGPGIHAAPWLGIAHAALAPIEDDPRFAGLYAAWTDRQADLVEACLTRQLIEPPAVGPADVVGGFDPRPVLPGHAPDPDWRTGPMLILLANALRDPAMPEARDRLGWLLSADLAVAFLDRLVFAEASCFYHRSVLESLGGMRWSLTDNRVATAPHAMGLVAAVELLTTLDALKADRADGP